MPLSQKLKTKKDLLISELEIQIKDKQDLIARMTANHQASLDVVQNELDELTLKKDGLNKLT